VFLLVGLRGKNSQHLVLTLLAPCIPGPCPHLILARASHVRHFSFSNTIPSPQSAFMEATSVAIWNRNVIAVGIETTIWVVNGAFFIRGKSPSLDSQGHPSDLVAYQVSHRWIRNFRNIRPFVLILPTGPLYKSVSRRLVLHGAQHTGH
jgi:hypothetical protein